jgi:hypothetical protein
LKGTENIPADTLSRVFDETINHFGIHLDSETEELRDEIVLKLEIQTLEKILNGNIAKGIAESFDKFWGEEEISEEALIEENILGFIDYSLPSNEEWIKAQCEDAEFKDVYTFLLSKTLPTDAHQAKITINESKYYKIDKKNKEIAEEHKS